MEKQVVTLEEIMKGVKEEISKSVSPLSEKLDNLDTNLAKETSKSADKKEYNARVITARIEAMLDQRKGVAMENGIVKHIESIIQERYGKKDPAFVKDFSRHIVEKDLMASGNGGELIIEEYAAGFLDQLWDATLFDKLGVRMMPTASGNLRISKIVEGVSAGYVGEGGTIDTSSLKFGHIRLSVKKAMALVPISNDLIRYASLNAEALVVDQITKEFAQLMDVTFLYGAGGEYEPQGIIGAEGVQKVSGNPKASRDLGITMLNMLGKKNHSLDDSAFIMGWDTYEALQLEKDVNGHYFNPDLADGRFLGRPFYVTSKIKNKANKEDLVLVKASEITGIQGLGLDIGSSQEATILTKDGTLSAYGQDYTIVRAIIENDFKLNYGHAAVVANVDVAK